MPNLPQPEMLVKPREKHHNEKKIDKMKELTTMTLVGKTQAGSAGVQPIRLALRAGSARDSQLNATNCRWDGSLVPSHFTNFADNSELCYALKNPIKRVPPKADTLFVEGKKSLLTKKWICPFHAEPVQV